MPMLSSTTAKRPIKPEQLDLVFRALGDRTRRQLLSRLAEGPAMVTELAKPFDMSLAAIGKHIRVLEKAGLVKRAVQGRVHRCSLDALPMRDAEQWLAHYQQFWDATVDSLIHFVENDRGQE